VRLSAEGRIEQALTVDDRMSRHSSVPLLARTMVPSDFGRQARDYTQVSETTESSRNAEATRRPLPNAEQLLAGAAELIERGWCQHALAEDQDGRQVEPWSESACRWSPLGALTRVWHERRGVEVEVFEVAYAALALATGGRPEEWNAARWRTKRHVLRAFARARRFLPHAWRQIRSD
jgi:hypothetical protein